MKFQNKLLNCYRLRAVIIWSTMFLERKPLSVTVYHSYIEIQCNDRINSNIEIKNIDQTID